MSDNPVDPILGRVPSGVYILTARHGDQETGMLASWVVQAGFDPPAVTLAIKQGRYLNDWIDAGAPIVLNVLGQSQTSMLGHFGKGFEPGESAFDSLDIERTDQGVAVLPGVVGFLECEVTGHVDSGDHRIYLANVVGGKMTGDEKPMVHVRKSGLHY
jgi:flavin reductase (DIM6/NTAB) family NADH-FMN oxidoreductase RutF